MKENVESIYQWCSIVIEFFLKKDPDFVFMQELKKTFQRVDVKTNMKGLRTLKKEIELEFISELPEKDRIELKGLLGSKLLDSNVSLIVKDIVDRGLISNDDEYITLTSYVGSGGIADIESVNLMLVEYYNQR